MKVCLDTNVLVAAFATRGLCADLLRSVLADHKLILPSVVVVELRRIATKKLRLSPEALDSVQAVLDRFESVPPPSGPPPLRLRDSDDEVVLASALAGGAEILVSGDKDLLVVADDSPIPIVEPRAFWVLITGGAR